MHKYTDDEKYTSSSSLKDTLARPFSRQFIMRGSPDSIHSPAHKAIEICWNKCVPNSRQKYLQSSEILELIKELEAFLGVRRLLQPEEDTLLRATIERKPRLRLFKSECVSFILGLVHFQSVEDFLETRFQISPERVSRLVELDLMPASKGSSARDKYDSVDSRYPWSSYDGLQDYKPYNRFDLDREEPSTQLPYGSSRRYGDRLTGDFSLPSLLSKSNQKGHNEVFERVHERDRENSRFSGTPENRGRLRMGTNESGIFSFLNSSRQWLSSWISGPGKQKNVSFPNISEISENENKTDTNPGSLRPEYPTQEQKAQEVRESLAEIRAHARRLEQEREVPQNTTIDKTLDELQAAVREQARIISRLERERERKFKTRAPRIVSRLFVPWDHFTGIVTTFFRDLLEELLPQQYTQSVPDFALRVLGLFLGFFVIMNFFKLVYLIVMIAMYSSGTAVANGFSGRNAEQSVPFSWIQEFPLLEYWTYQLKDLMGY